MSTSRGVTPGSLPTRLFTRGTEPMFNRSFSYRSGLESLPNLSDHIPSGDLEEIRNGPLGVLLRFYEDSFLWSARLVHELLVHQLVTNKRYELWTLCGGQPIRFSLKEFEVITGLNCNHMPVEVESLEDDPDFLRKLGLCGNKEPTFNLINGKIMHCREWNSVDRIRLVYLFLVYRFLLACAPGKKIDSNAHVLVQDRERFEAYPWGRVAFKYLIESVKKATGDLDLKSYSVFGFVQVLQIWAYEAIPALGQKCGNQKEGMTEFPPLLRWKGSRNRCQFDLPICNEQVKVNYVLGTSERDQWEDELEDESIDNILLFVAGAKKKVFEKFNWEDKGMIDGPVVAANDEHRDATEEGSHTQKKRSKGTDDNLEDMKTYFANAMKEMTEKVQRQISTYVDDAVTKIENKMEQFAEGIKELQEESKNMKARVEMLESNVRCVQGEAFTKEPQSHKEAECSTKRQTKKQKTFNYELQDISIEDLPSEEDTVDCKMNDANSGEQVQSSDKALSETSSIRDHDMERKMDQYAARFDAMFKKKSIGKEKRQRKVSAQLKSPFKTTTAINKMNKKYRALTAYDPFELVDEISVNALDDWLTQNLIIKCADGTEEEGKIFFDDLRTPTTHISDAHIDAGMTLFRRRSLISPCPYRDGRIAFMDSGFSVAISHNYTKFLEDPKNYKWKSGAVDYYKGILPTVGCTNKQFGKDVDDIYVVIHIRGNHWVALAISIPNRTIHVYDSITAYTKDTEIERYVKPYAHMIPYMLKAFASEKKGMSLAQYKVSRRSKIPQNIQSGDCGVYALKYIECLALGCEFEGLCDQQIKRIRAKLAAEIFVESKDLGFY